MTEILSQLAKAERNFLGTKYSEIVKEAISLFTNGCHGSCLSKLEELPTEEQLLDMLLPILEGKSVCRTLIKIQEGKVKSKFTKIKAFSSLMTHASIECEKGRKEFQVLIPFFSNQIYQLLA